MVPIANFRNTGIRVVFTDIDDTLTDEGRLTSSAYAALWQLQGAGIAVIPVTGRPAGWCEMIARQWPVMGVIGENGGFYFRYTDRTMKRYFVEPATTRRFNQKRLERIQAEVLSLVPEAAVASDQFCRVMDLAIDYCEDIPPLTNDQTEQIINIFKKHGAQVKMSSIHINGWFGSYDKLSTCRHFAAQELNMDLEKSQDLVAFIGDSPNDEPMFAFFRHSFAVANVTRFLDQMQNHPAYLTTSPGGAGFAEFAQALIS